MRNLNSASGYTEKISCLSYIGLRPRARPRGHGELLNLKLLRSHDCKLLLYTSSDFKKHGNLCVRVRPSFPARAGSELVGTRA